MTPEDQDIRALSEAINALYKSSSAHMLRANMRFLWDYFVAHPSERLPAHLKDPGPSRENTQSREDQ